MRVIPNFKSISWEPFESHFIRSSSKIKKNSSATSGAGQTRRFHKAADRSKRQETVQRTRDHLQRESLSLTSLRVTSFSTVAAFHIPTSHREKQTRVYSNQRCRLTHANEFNICSLASNLINHVKKKKKNKI